MADKLPRPNPRLFVAVELSQEWLRWVRSVVDRLRPTLGDTYRFVRPELLHITLCFLGAQHPDRLSVIVEVLESAAATARPLRLTPNGVGGFGGRHPRVVWVGANDGSGRLRRLRSRLDELLDQDGISFDRKPLIPHVTVARPRANAGRVRLAAVPTTTGIVPPPLDVRHLTLMNSRLGPGGPRYEVIHRAQLGGSTPPST